MHLESLKISDLLLKSSVLQIEVLFLEFEIKIEFLCSEELIL